MRTFGRSHSVASVTRREFVSCLGRLPPLAARLGTPHAPWCHRIPAAAIGTALTQGGGQGAMHHAINSATPGSADGKVVIIWHRRDLRLTDNSCYHGLQNAARVVPVYCFDPRDFSRRPSVANPQWDTITVGPHAARFLLESLNDLRSRLRSLGSELLVRHGHPEAVLPALAAELAADAAPDATGTTPSSTLSTPPASSALHPGVQVRWNRTPVPVGPAVEDRVAASLAAWPCLGSIETYLDFPLRHPDDIAAGWTNRNAAAGSSGGGGRGGGKGGKGKRKHNDKPQSKQQQHKKAMKPDAGQAHDGTPSLLPFPGPGDLGRIAEWRRLAKAAASPRMAAAALESLPPAAASSVDPGELPDLAALLAPAVSPCSSSSSGGSTAQSNQTRPLLGVSPGLREDFVRSVVDSSTRPSPVSSSSSSSSVSPSSSSRGLRGGKSAGLERLREFLAHVSSGKAVDTGGVGAAGINSSSRLGAYLAWGCLSPRTVHEACSAVPSAAWLSSHLEMRDFHGLRALSIGPQLCTAWPNDPAEDSVVVSGDAARADEVLQRWASGQTGFPLVDAGMRELAATGHCSVRCRMIATSLLVHDLALSWRLGAELLQWLLVDADWGSNWGNHAASAPSGGGCARRRLRVIQQSVRHDPDGLFVRAWLPELRQLSGSDALRPFGVLDAWPDPLVDPANHV